MGELNLEDLRSMVEILRYRWDAIILERLVRRQRRFRELQQTRDPRGEQITNGVLATVLRRLADDGLITKQRDSHGYVRYRATADAVRIIQRLERIGDTSGNQLSNDRKE